MKNLNQAIVIACFMLMLTSCEDLSLDKGTGSSEQSDSVVDKQIVSQDEGVCPIPEASINDDDPRFDPNYRFLFKADTYVVYPAGACAKYIHYSDGSKEVREKGYDYLAVMPRIDLYDFKINGDQVEIKFQNLTADAIMVDEKELEEVFGTSIYKFETLRPARLIHQGKEREGYAVYFFRKDRISTLEEKQEFNAYHQTFDLASNTLLINVSENRAFFDQCLAEGHLSLEVFTQWDAPGGWPEFFIFRYILAL